MLGTGSIVPAKVLRCQFAAWQVAQSISSAGRGSSGSSAARTRFSRSVSSGSRLNVSPVSRAARPAGCSQTRKRGRGGSPLPRHRSGVAVRVAYGATTSVLLTASLNRALWNSRFRRAMNFTLTPFGQAASHS